MEGVNGRETRAQKAREIGMIGAWIAIIMGIGTALWLTLFAARKKGPKDPLA